MNAEQYREHYLKMHPASMPEPPRAVQGESRLIRWGVLAMFIAASVISGAHTVPMIYATLSDAIPGWARLVVSGFGFVAVELAIFIGAYARKRGGVVLVVLATVFLMALVSNITGTAEALNAGADGWMLVASLIMGFGVPLVALLAGDMVAHGQAQQRDAERDAWHVYRAELKALDVKIASSFEKYQLKQLPESTPVHEDFTKIRETSREKQPRVKIHEIVAAVRENGDQQLSVTEMMDKYQISAGSTSKVRQMLSNGHGEV